jgi:hypothetical protein
MIFPLLSKFPGPASITTPKVLPSDDLLRIIPVFDFSSGYILRTTIRFNSGIIFLKDDINY